MPLIAPSRIRELTLNPAQIKYLLDDQFSDTRIAGLVNGTPAVPGPGVRTVTDIKNRAAIVSGNLVFVPTTTTAVATVVYEALTRNPGRIIMGRLSSTINHITMGFGTSQDLTAQSETSILDAYYGWTTLANTTVGTLYYHAIILRSAGSYIFVKGGSFVNWTLLWIRYINAASSAQITINAYANASSNKADFIRIPDLLWLPTPLAYDTFSRGDGALGDTEPLGPDNQATPIRLWTGATWSISTNKAINTPTTTGSNLVTNGNFSAWTGDDPDNWTVTGEDANNYITEVSGKARVVSVAGSLVPRIGQNILTVGKWYTISCNVIAYVSGSMTLQSSSGPCSVSALSTGMKYGAGVSLNVQFRFWGANSTCDWTIDDVTCTELVLSSLFSSVSATSANVLISTGITIPSTSGHLTGIVSRLDSASSPANFILCFIIRGESGTSCQVYKCVAGAYTNLISATVTYSAGAKLVVSCDGNLVRVYYNNALVGTEQTVSDAGIVNNTLHGLFSTDPSNTFDDFLVFPRGNNNEYSFLDLFTNPPANPQQPYLLEDNFQDIRLPGSVNGTPATPGPGTRAVLDSNNKLSIGSGVASFATGGSANYNPGVMYGGIARVLGRFAVIQVNASSSDNTWIGWSNAASWANTATTRLRFGTGIISYNSAAQVIDSALAVSTNYTFAFVLRATGSYLFMKGGVYTSWRLMWVENALNNATMYPGINGGTATVFTSSFIRVPEALWIPTALAYDTFNRADGALGSTETVGPDGSTAPALPVTARLWNGATWTISTNKAINTPVPSVTDVIVNGAFTTDANWNKDTGWTIDAGDSNVATCDGTNAAYITADVAPLTVGKWYKATCDITARTAGSMLICIGDGGGDAFSTAGATYTQTSFAGATSARIRSASFAGSVDNFTCKEMTLAELISSVSVASAEVIASVAVVRNGAASSGLICRLDSATSPANFLLAILRNNAATASVFLYKCVGGTYTLLIAASAAYSAGANLVVSCDGNLVRVYYNNALVGTEQTVSDAGIVNNTLHGLFSTDPLNTFDNFLVMPRGNAGEYSILDTWIGQEAEVPGYWLLKDDFPDTKAAGSVNGTEALPSGGLRAAADTNSKLSLSGGLASFATGGFGAGNPGLWYAIQNRVAGRVMVAQKSATTAANFQGWFGYNVIQSGDMSYGIGFGNDSADIRSSEGALKLGIWQISTDYKLAIVMRATGFYYFIKGGAFTNWTLLWVTYVNNANLYPALIGFTASSFSHSFIRVPALTWLPTPLAYDTFTRVDGAIGTSEAVGPDSQVVLARTWTGGTWTISSGKAINTPVTFGGDLVTNGNFTAWTGDNPDGWAVSGESGTDPEVSEVATNEGHGGTGTGACNIYTSAGVLVSISQNVLTAGLWYRYQFKITNIVAGGITLGNTNAITNISSVGTYSIISRAATAGILINRATGATDITIDDIVVMQATLSELFSSIVSGSANILVSAAITMTENSMHTAGFVYRLDSASSPSNFIIAYVFDNPGGAARVYLDKCVAGVYTSLFNATITYSAGARLVVTCDGSSVSVYYNNAQVGTTQTVSDAGILSNTLHGLFSTDPSNTFDDFTIMPRGNGGEYGTLDGFIQ